jgi:hypothetical protein
LRAKAALKTEYETALAQATKLGLRKYGTAVAGKSRQNENSRSPLDLHENHAKVAGGDSGNGKA